MCQREGEGEESSCRCCLPLLRTSSARTGNGPYTARHLLRTYQPCKVLLYPEEGWARSAMSSYWILSPCWWRKSRCKVTEVTGARRFSTRAVMVSSGNNLCIVGSFKKMMSDPDFKLSLTCNVSMSDFNMGYMMTGSLERGHKKNNFYQTTHFAIVQRIDFVNS